MLNNTFAVLSLRLRDKYLPKVRSNGTLNRDFDLAKGYVVKGEIGLSILIFLNYILDRRSRVAIKTARTRQQGILHMRPLNGRFCDQHSTLTALLKIPIVKNTEGEIAEWQTDSEIAKLKHQR